MAPPKKPVASAPAKKTNTTPIVIGAIAAVVVIAAIVAVVAVLAGGGDGESKFADGATIREFQGVTIEGEALPSLVSGGADTAVGMQAPALKGAYFDGTPVSVTPGDGKQYMLVFLAHWCPHCNAEAPRLLEWFESGTVPEGLEVVGIATGSDQKNPNWPPSDWLMNDMKWPWTAMADSPQAVAAETYGLDGYPFTVIIGSDGAVLARFSGEQGDMEAIAAQVEAALATDGDVSPTDTEAPAGTDAPTDTAVTEDTTTE